MFSLQNTEAFLTIFFFGLTVLTTELTRSELEFGK